MDYPFNQLVALDPPDPPDPPAAIDPSIERFTQWVYTVMGVRATAH
jgi:hypothetical protein